MLESALKPHSKIGVTSFVCSILSIISFWLIFVFNLIGGEFWIKVSIVSFWVSFGSALLAFILGIITIFCIKHKRIFGILGLILGFLEIISLVSIIFILNKFLESVGKALGSGFGKM